MNNPYQPQQFPPTSKNGAVSAPPDPYQPHTSPQQPQLPQPQFTTKKLNDEEAPPTYADTFADVVPNHYQQQTHPRYPHTDGYSQQQPEYLQPLHSRHDGFQLQQQQQTYVSPGYMQTTPDITTTTTDSTSIILGNKFYGFDEQGPCGKQKEIQVYQFNWKSMTTSTQPTSTGGAGQLMTQITQQYGPQSLMPPPDAFNTDKEKKLWLKRDQNTLTYFLYRSNKYKRYIEDITNKTPCEMCCMSTPETKQPGEFNRCVCCNVCLGSTMGACGCCGVTCMDAAPLVYAFDITKSDSSIHNTAQGCCLCCTGSMMNVFRKDFYKRLEKAGITLGHYAKNNECCFLCCCATCEVVRMQHIMEYYLLKRYGHYTGMVSSTTEPSATYQRYADLIKEDTSGHPYSYKLEWDYRLKLFGGARYPVHNLMRRERLASKNNSLTGSHLLKPQYPPFNEWILEKLPEVVEAHNEFWKNVHTTVLVVPRSQASPQME